MRPDEIVRKILEARGVVSEDGRREFLSDRPRLAHAPLALPGAREGADFLLDALARGKKICVYGDYDVDGICGAALTVLFLREAASVLGGGASVFYYIPSRIEEGYGLNNQALLAIRDAGADAVVTVDCGSVSAAEALYAREIGLDILITDHHNPDMERLPDCPHVNPKLPAQDAFYPFEMLSGSGVAFKLCGAVLEILSADGDVKDAGETLRSLLRSLVDLVCVATIADVMPLVDENRTFVKYGLLALRSGRRPAFRALIDVAGLKAENLSARDVAFGLAPRINALGRMGDATEGVEFFLSQDESYIRIAAERMDARNTERKRVQDLCFQDCMSLYETAPDSGEPLSYPFLLLRPDNAHEGVSGIVAGKVRETAGLPCAVLSESGECGQYLKGSARSAGRLDLIALLRRHGALFERLGGHAAAAGFLIRKENEGALREALSAELAAMLAREPDLLDERQTAELEVKVSDLTPALAEALAALEPFGSGNPRPALALGVAAGSISGVKNMGRDGKHLRFDAEGISCVFFGGGDMVFPATGSLRIIGCPEINEWKGIRRIQLAVTHIDML